MKARVPLGGRGGTTRAIAESAALAVQAAAA